MKKIDTIVVAPHFYTMEGAGVGYHGDAAMAVDGGKILEVGDRSRILVEYTAEETIILDHHMVLPGFIDGHMHTACNIMRGLAQDTNSWMMFGLQPFDNAVNDKERDAGSRVAILEAIRAGTTTLGDYESKMENVCAFIDKVGARGNIAQTIRAAKRRVYQPGELYEFDDAMGEESLNRNIALYDQWNNKAGGRIKILFGPQGADFVSPEMLLRIQKAVKDRGTKIHMHVQQGDRETYRDRSALWQAATAFLDELGYLDESLIAVHLTDCTDEEAALIFVTTSSDHAVDSYGVRASGYLIKPFTYEAFGETMRLARLGKIMNARFIALGDDRILLKEILWCDRDGHYVQIHTDMQGVLRYRVAFASLEAVLSAYPQFLPCYRGLIINMDRVRRMEELEFLMDTGERVPFRKRDHKEIKSRFSQYMFRRAREEDLL